MDASNTVSNTGFGLAGGSTALALYYGARDRRLSGQEQRAGDEILRAGRAARSAQDLDPAVIKTTKDAFAAVGELKMFHPELAERLSGKLTAANEAGLTAAARGRANGGRMGASLCLISAGLVIGLGGKAVG